MVDQAAPKRKLIEVALPLEAINRESAREKSIRHGHPSTLHLWWARRPLAAARAVLFAQLVDDPSSNPASFPTEELQRKERDRLHEIIERLVVWENLRDEKLLAEARAEIFKSTNGHPPPILDPFAGGGTIPLEAQRLGLEAYASDLNPVAVLINKALIEIPPKFRNMKPIFPGLAESEIRAWNGAEGLAADVRAYGSWICSEAQHRLGRLYPKADLPSGSKATVIAWIWARTVRCPNPACKISIPLARNWWLSKKKNKEVFIRPTIEADAVDPSGQRVHFEIVHGKAKATQDTDDGTVSGRTGAVCVACKTAVPVAYLRTEGQSGRLGQVLVATVVEGNRERIYLPPTEEHAAAAQVQRPADSISGEIADNPRWFSPPIYGMKEFADLFTNRQLTSLTAFSDLVEDARQKALEDGAAIDYADGLATYLALWVDRIANRSTAFNIWNTIGEKIEQLYARNAIPMMWHFPEVNLFSDSSGNARGQLEYLCDALAATPASTAAHVSQADAADLKLSGALLATDPPYYDNIGYSDLSDFFYVWLRRTLKHIYPNILSTMLVPKAEELVANPYRHNGPQGAREFFEHGFQKFFAHARKHALADYPITVWYAFKQTESNEGGVSSTGWETLLDGMVGAGWTVTSTWPLRSERTGRLGSNGTNSLASAIALSLRPREHDARTTDRRGFITALESELPNALRKLQQGQIAPVDLPQAAIGPGIAVFSRYSAVLEPDGSRMTVRAALSRINEILDQVLAEQEGDFDSTTRFALAWYRQHGYGAGKFGDADNLARARITSVDVMARDGILLSRAGVVQLIKPSDLGWDYDISEDEHTSNWEALHHLIKILERDGISPASEILHAALKRPDNAIDPDLITELAHLLFRISESNGWTKEALSFNSLVTSWPEILGLSRATSESRINIQSAFEFDEGDD